MTRNLVLVHGRSQSGRDPATLKQEWIGALERGLAKSQTDFITLGDQVRFPYYGDTLSELSKGLPPDEAAKVIVRGTAFDSDLSAIGSDYVETILSRGFISREQFASTEPEEAVQRGILNWSPFRQLLVSLDRNVPWASGHTIALITTDVHHYLTNSGFRKIVEDGIASSITPDVETIVVAHSLGSIVAYNLLCREGHLRNWKIPLFVTLGSPLAVNGVKEALKKFGPLRVPLCVETWLNAMDPYDIVSLHPLTSENFPINPTYPPIENRIDVKNFTPNHHGVSGYLEDGAIANRIASALNQ